MELIVVRKGHRTHTNISAGATATQAVPDNVNRKSVSFQNQGTGPVFVGPSGVTISGANVGFQIPAGATFTDNASAEAWFIVASAATPVHVIDVE
jgi:hypothetical protein